jgi:hypothetical protein
MSTKSPNDPEIPDKDAGARMDAQPRKHFGSPIEEDAIPWAEIILEEEPLAAGAVKPVTREPLLAETARDEGFVSPISGMHEEHPLDGQIAGPPLAVLAVALLVFLLLLEM